MPKGHSNHSKSTEFEVGEQVWVYPGNENYFRNLATDNLTVIEIDKPEAYNGEGLVRIEDCYGKSLACFPWRLHKSKFMERINEIYREESDVQR